jgi:hypothetical protein
METAIEAAEIAIGEIGFHFGYTVPTTNVFVRQRPGDGAAADCAGGHDQLGAMYRQ